MKPKNEKAILGYSGTPLVKKLGIRAGDHILLMNAPERYEKWIEPIPDNLRILAKGKKGAVDFIHLFADEKKTFGKRFLDCKSFLRLSGMLWVSWPKKSSGTETDLDENTVREFGLENGLVDVKVCAVSEVWSGLKFVYRLKDRK